MAVEEVARPAGAGALTTIAKKKLRGAKVGKPSENELRRYMDVTALLDMLLNKHLPLLNPRSWDDKNDSHFLEVYRERCKLKSVRAACFSKKPETYHHWKVFAPGRSGICVIFDRRKFIRYVDAHPQMRGGHVNYKTNPQLRKIRELPDADLPFIKRKPYEDEAEYRVIFDEALFACDDAHCISMDLKLIKRIVVSPWMSRNLYLSLKRTIALIEDCKTIPVTRSLLVDTEMWKDALAAIHTIET